MIQKLSWSKGVYSFQLKSLSENSHSQLLAPCLLPAASDPTSMETEVRKRKNKLRRKHFFEAAFQIPNLPILMTVLIKTGHTSVSEILSVLQG